MDTLPLTPLFRLAISPMVLVDADGILVRANPAFLAATGLVPEAVYGQHWLLLFGDTDRAACDEAWAAVRVARQHRAHLRTAEGARRPIRWRGEPSDDAAYWYFQGTFEEAAEAHAEEDTAQLEVDLRLDPDLTTQPQTLLQQAMAYAFPDLAVVIDEDGRYVLAHPSPRSVRYDGVFALVGRTIDEVFDAEDAHLLQGLLRKALDEGAHTATYTLAREDHAYWYDAQLILLDELQGERRLVVWTVRDITERVEARQRLQEREAQLRLVLEAGHMGLWTWEIETNSIEWSDEVVSYLGLTPDLFDGSLEGYEALVHPDDKEWWQAELERALADRGVYTTRHRLLLPDGSIRWVQGTGYVETEDGEPVRMVGIAENVTEQVQAEEALRTSEERFQKAFMASPNGILITTLPDGIVREVNEGFMKISGYTADEAIGRSVIDMNLWGDLHERAEIMSVIHETGRLRNREIPVRLKSGRLATCRLSAEVIYLDGRPHLLSVVEDVTEQVRAHEALQQSEERYRRLVEAVPDSIIVHRRGIVEYINPAGLKLLGAASEDDILGRPVLDFVVPSMQSFVKQRMQKLLTQDILAPVELERLMRLDGSEVLVEITGVRVGSAEDPAIQVLVRDVTQREANAQERERLFRELESKNAELEQFTYTVSHDLKAPLITIKGFLGMIKRDVEQNHFDRVATDLTRIEGAASKMGQLLDELLALSRVGRITRPPEQVSLTAIIAEACELLDHDITHRQAEMVVPSSAPMVFGDPVRIREVFQNLMHNALKFSQEDIPPRIEVEAAADGDWVRCTIRDNGIGIDASYQERIFGLFERLDASVPGTGVGLALVKRIVEVHGGTITMSSDGPGHGATFVFTLPRYEPGRHDTMLADSVPQQNPSFGDGR